MDFHVERIFKGPGFAETLYLGTCEGRRIIRKASNPDALPFSRTALAREIRLLRNLVPSLKPYFPEVLRTNLDDHTGDTPEFTGSIYYDMPYYAPEDGWVTFSAFLLDGTASRDCAYRVLGDILDTAFMYFTIDNREPEEDYAEKTMLCNIRENLSWALSHSDFQPLFNLKNIHLCGKPVKNFPELEKYFQDTPLMRSILTPHRDRFLHGDFFPENIMYNIRTGRWILLDPVSVRGVHRGDFILDINKMDDWLSGELPALRMSRFRVDITGNTVDFDIFSRSGKLENLHRLGLSEWYRKRLDAPEYTGLFSQEPGWRLRQIFVKIFYSLCMLPLADTKQAITRYFLALRSMADFIEQQDKGY